ncbi:MAG: hypothetical protein JST30_16410 [Armatimonadetes bacterium]|nr:hypothetical protein [Armatimonadota bacterium]
MSGARACAALSFALVASSVFAQLEQREVRGFEDALKVAGFSLSDLKFERKPFRDKYRMPVVDLSLDDPLGAGDVLMAWHASAAQAKASALLAAGQKNAFLARPLTQPSLTVPVAPLSAPGVPQDLTAALAPLVVAVQAADAEIKSALAPLTPAEQRELIESLPQWAVEEPKVTFGFVRSKASPQSRILALLDKVDVARIRAASVWVTSTAESVAETLKARPVAFAGVQRVSLNGLPVLIAGQGDDVHDETDARITVDLGGDDLYRGRHGAGVGYCSVLIDVSGNDRYAVKDLSVGAAELGIGVALDLGGDDSFRGASLAFGAGLCGVGVFVKHGGDDTYDSVALSQGFGEVGIGLLLDTGGDDAYRLKLFGQGAARTQGLGWLVDQKGSDTYSAGGLSMNSPLFTGVSYSNAQGYAAGYREDTGGVSGGIALLTDLGGSDAYWGETYLQGASYWFALASLYDASGNDTYSAYHYAQASAMHCCGAYLFDLQGDDSYTTKYGASLAIGHDYGVAVLLDRAGDDLFVARDSSPGVGIANGLGLFLDGNGTDRYDGPPGQGNAARSTGSLGVFADLGGPDKYRAGLADGTATASSLWGAGYDVQDPSATAGGASPQHQRPRPGTRPLASEAELGAIYAKATQWGVGSARQEVEDNIDALVAMGVPAFEWMLDKRLAEADRLQQRAFAEVVKTLGVDGAAAMARKSFKGSVAERRNLIGIAVDAGVVDFGSLLGKMLEDPALQMAAAKAAGPLKATGTVGNLMRLCLDPDRLLARAAMVSLAVIADPTTVSTAQAMLRSTDLPTRQAAVDLLAALPAQSADTVAMLVADSDERNSRTGVLLMGRRGRPEDLNAIGAMLLDPRAGIRLEALRQLNGRCPQEYVAAFKTLADDAEPVVRAYARNCRPD